MSPDFQRLNNKFNVYERLVIYLLHLYLLLFCVLFLISSEHIFSVSYASLIQKRAIATSKDPTKATMELWLNHAISDLDYFILRFH